MAQTVGTVDGNAVGIYIDDVYVACTTSNAFSMTREVIESVCKTAAGSSVRSKKPGTLDGEISLSGNWAFDASYGASDLITAMLASTQVVAMFSTQQVGDDDFFANCYITAFSATADVDSDTTYDCTLSMNGDPTYTEKLV